MEETNTVIDNKCDESSLVVGVSTELKTCMIINIKYADDSVDTTIVAENEVYTITYIEDGKLKTITGRIDKLYSTSLDVDCSEQYKTETHRVIINNIRKIGHPTMPLK